VHEDDSPSAVGLFDLCGASGVRLIAPHFFFVETDSILCQKLRLRHAITIGETETAFAKLRTMPIEQGDVPGQRDRAWEIARRFEFPTVYDATYLALAELRGCEFWIADRRLYNRVKDDLPFVRLLGSST
jgi:predicted nucleic acid-binding protein